MDIVRIPGHTRILGTDQGYRPLPLRDEIMDCGPIHGAQPVMVTHWRPSAQELARLAAGAPVELRIMGRAWPPVLIDVGEVEGGHSAGSATGIR